MQIIDPQGLKDWRLIKGVSQKELADKIGVHVNTIFNWEKDPSTSPIGQVAMLCMALDCSPNEIVFPFIRMCLLHAQVAEEVEADEDKNGSRGEG